MTTVVKTIHFDPNAFGHLPLPGGKTAAEVPNIHSIIVDQLAIPGTSHTQGRQELLQHYADHLEQIGKAAADKAVADWLAAR